jgi:hypothetical protein
MSPIPTSAASAPAPPLPNLQSGGDQKQSGSNPLASIMSGIQPIKTAVDSITAACKTVVQSGVIPGSEQICGQIVALATSLLPMAAQQVLQPGGGGGGSIPPVSSGGGLTAVPPGQGGVVGQ